MSIFYCMCEDSCQEKHEPVESRLIGSMFDDPNPSAAEKTRRKSWPSYLIE